MILLTSGNSYFQIIACAYVYNCTSFHFWEFSVQSLTFSFAAIVGYYYNQKYSSIIQFTPIHINLGVLIRKGDKNNSLVLWILRRRKIKVITVTQLWESNLGLPDESPTHYYSATSLTLLVSIGTQDITIWMLILTIGVPNLTIGMLSAPACTMNLAVNWDDFHTWVIVH